MNRHLANRLLATFVTIWLITLAIFFIVRFLPGDPAQAILGLDASPEEVEALREKLGLNKPVTVQYIEWLGGMFHGDFGKSIFTGRPVIDMLKMRIPVTLTLTLYALAIALLISIPSGIISAVRSDYSSLVLRAFSLFGISIPSFWMGILLILLFAVYLRWFPTASYVNLLADPFGSMKSLTLPAFALGLYAASVITRQLRSSMLETLAQDYIRTARSKGLAERAVIYKHALKNALIPVVTVTLIEFGYLMGGSIIIEAIFAIPGMGTMLITSALNRDYYVLQGFVLVYAISFALMNFIADVIYIYLNPQIRY
jgi:peptide/nickel transport system permease protein